jgi:phosphatidylserine/phosphatidylglycerophosphate/cardiolipin synthase-like enzyme
MTRKSRLTLLVQPETGLAPVIQALRRAKRTIDVAIFRLTRRDLEEALAAAVARGVKVRALVAHRNNGGEARLRKVEQRLLEAGVIVARTSDEFTKYHGKYLIIDETLHLLGFNFTKANVTKTRSFGIQSRDRRAVADALRLFESDLTRQPFTPTRTSPLVVSPESARATLERFVGGARKRLAVYDSRLEDPAFVKLIRQRADAGVQVQIIGKAPRLEAEIPVRGLKGLKLHVRAMVRDASHVFVGSQSLRRLELDDRREVGLVITNPAVARHMLQVFDEDWERSGSKVNEEEGSVAVAGQAGHA